MACRVKYEAPLSERYGYLTCFLNELVVKQPLVQVLPEMKGMTLHYLYIT